MFTISLKALYALNAVVHLGQRYNRRLSQIQDIATENRIPRHYLEQIMIMLRRAALVKSVRGIHGGYSLLRSPEEITVREVLTSVEGELAVVNDMEKAGGLDFFWREIEQAIAHTLEWSIDTLIQRRQQQGDNFIYTI